MGCRSYHFSLVSVAGTVARGISTHPPPTPIGHDIFGCIIGKKITFCGWNCGIIIYILDIFLNNNTKLCKNNIVA